MKIFKKMSKVVLATAIAVTMIFSGTASAFADTNQSQEPAGYVYISVDRATIGQGYLLEPEKIPFYEGENGAQVLDRALKMHNFELEYTGNIDDSFYMAAIKNAGGDLTAKFPTYLQKYIEEKGINVTNPRGSESLGQFDYTNYSGWVFKYNNRHAPVGASGIKCEDGMTFRWAFTVCGYGSDCWNTGWGSSIAPYAVNKDPLIKTVADFKASDDFDELMKAAEVKSAFDDVIKAGTDNEIDQDAIDARVLALEKAIENEKSNIKAASDVDLLINAIGTVTLESESKIKDARTAYDGLSDGAKRHVTKLSVLENAERELAALKDADKKPEGTTDPENTENNSSKPADKDNGKVENNAAKTPQTGDDSNLALFGLLLGVSVASLYFTRKKNNI